MGNEPFYLGEDHEQEMLRMIDRYVVPGSRVLEGGAGPPGSSVTTALRNRIGSGPNPGYVASYDPYLSAMKTRSWEATCGVLSIRPGTATVMEPEQWSRSTIRAGGPDHGPVVNRHEADRYVLADEIRRVQADTLVLDVEGSEAELLFPPLPDRIKTILVEVHFFAFPNGFWSFIVEGLLTDKFSGRESFDIGSELAMQVWTR